MNAETLEIARRMVACPKWVWLPGMHAVAERRDWPGMGIRVDESRDGWLFYGRASNSEASMRPAGMVPNLDDDLTRIGVIAVVRRAYDDTSMGLVGSREGFWCISRPQMAGDTHPLAVDLRWMSRSEVVALLAALESAP